MSGDFDLRIREGFSRLDEMGVCMRRVGKM
jgi:hypothetical protein